MDEFLVINIIYNEHEIVINNHYISITIDIIYIIFTPDQILNR